MMVLKKFFNDGAKKVIKYMHFICQVLKCLKKLKIHSTK